MEVYLQAPIRLLGIVLRQLSRATSVAYTIHRRMTQSAMTGREEDLQRIGKGLTDLRYWDLPVLRRTTHKLSRQPPLLDR